MYFVTRIREGLHYTNDKVRNGLYDLVNTYPDNIVESLKKPRKTVQSKFSKYRIGADGLTEEQRNASKPLERIVSYIKETGKEFWNYGEHNIWLMKKDPKGSSRMMSKALMRTALASSLALGAVGYVEEKVPSREVSSRIHETVASYISPSPAMAMDMSKSSSLLEERTNYIVKWSNYSPLHQIAPVASATYSKAIDLTAIVRDAVFSWKNTESLPEFYKGGVLFPLLATLPMAGYFIFLHPVSLDDFLGPTPMKSRGLSFGKTRKLKKELKTLASTTAQVVAAAYFLPILFDAATGTNVQASSIETAGYLGLSTALGLTLEAGRQLESINRVRVRKIKYEYVIS
ncbi:MAG: hypothetical protein QW331_02055 [Candidatus Woesearchaeota archaeon]